MEIRVQTSTNYINQNYQFKLIKTQSKGYDGLNIYYKGEFKKGGV